MLSAAPRLHGSARGHGRRIVATLGMLVLAQGPCLAQEPLFIRIRPLPDAEAARAAREAVWARRQAHARAVIETVCTGCLGAWQPATEAPAEPSSDRVADLTVPTGVELDPGSGASVHPDPSSPERQP